MSFTFTLKGHGAELSSRFFPSIQLDELGEYSLGLVDLETFFSIPNIEEGCDTFHYVVAADDDEIRSNELRNKKSEDGKLIESDNSLREQQKNLNDRTRFIKIPTGSYEIRDIEQYLKDHLESTDKIKIRANANTLKSEIKCKHNIDFSREDSIAPLLGFSHREELLVAGEWHVSDKPVNILKVNVIRVECNLVSGSYINGEEAHTLHEFFPNVPPGVKIIEVPSNVIYLPINKKTIDSISVRLLDQNGHLINFRNESVTLRLHLRKRQ